MCAIFLACPVRALLLAIVLAHLSMCEGGIHTAAGQRPIVWASPSLYPEKCMVHSNARVHRLRVIYNLTVSYRDVCIKKRG